MPSPILCTCAGSGRGARIVCSGSRCPVEWYHWRCVGIKSAPVGKWLCALCRPQKTDTRARVRESRVEEQDTVEKAPVKRRKSQRMTRIVYETTEYSIFEHIIEESRKAVLVVKGGAEAQEVASAPDAEDRGAELGVASREKQRERKKRGKVERVMTEVSKEVEEDLEAGLEAELEAELEAGLEAESSFMDIELATYTSSNPASKGVRWRW